MSEQAKTEISPVTNEEFYFVDRKAPEVMAALAEAPIFKKQGLVKARPALPGEKIVTKLASGAEETVNTAGEDDLVMTNPSGEEYIISRQKFLGRYEETSESGVYSAKGYCRAIRNPFSKPIEIMAEWGEPQQGDQNCMIADTCDAEGKLTGEPYIIEDKAFQETYKQVSE